MLCSMACRTAHFFEPWYGDAVRYVGHDTFSAPIEERNLHRKVWEWAAIHRALDERGMLAAGRRGLGFAVGQEPLAGCFANRGVQVLATDLDDMDTAKGWADTGQHAANREVLYHERLHDRSAFERNVTFRPADMTDLSSLPVEDFDFVWSACSLEHLGTLKHGIDFVLNSTRLLRPGGVGVHTTEYNLSSDTETIEAGYTVIYRERDLRQLDRDLRRQGAGLEPLDLHGGTHEFDLKADFAPYHANGRKHVKLNIEGHICTSVLLIVRN
jgi:2-polyprenyl-3-methyl-5-hydroxy-6-metoxy-1,4-benzoquinol methylase